jgi:hypothetical protein
MEINKAVGKHSPDLRGYEIVRSKVRIKIPFKPAYTHSVKSIHPGTYRERTGGVRIPEQPAVDIHPGDLGTVYYTISGPSFLNPEKEGFLVSFQDDYGAQKASIYMTEKEFEKTGSSYTMTTVRF